MVLYKKSLMSLHLISKRDDRGHIYHKKISNEMMNLLDKGSRRSHDNHFSCLCEAKLERHINIKFFKF